MTARPATPVLAAIVPALLAAGALLAGTAATAAEDIDAQALVDKNCTSCHGSEMYTREDRKIGSFSALETQVEACNTNLDTGMFPEEVKAVATLLNQEYYKFEQ